MARRRKSFPPIPSSAPRDLQAMLRAMVEVLEVGDGVRGDSLDRKVTVRDLVDGGIAKRRDGARPGGSGGGGLEPNQPPPNMTTPPLPQEFYAVGSFWGRIDLSWTIPSELYGNHGYTNIYRADTDNLANAELIGREVGMFYTDTLRNDTVTDDEQNKGAYYWIRFVSSTGVEGPPNATAGTYAAPIMDLGVLLDTLSGQIRESELAQSLNSRINLIDGDMPGSVNARVSEEKTQRVQGQEALAQSISQVSTNLGDKVSTVEQSLTSKADALTGRLNAMYTLRTDVNGHIAGFGLSNDGESSNFIIQADKFAVANGGNTRYPLILQDGNTFLDTAMIRTASIQSAQIGSVSFGKIVKSNGTPVTTVGGLLRADAIDVNNLKVAESATFTGDVYSDNFRSGVRGWCMLQSGYVEFNEAMIRGNLEVQSITVNGNSPFGAINVERDRFTQDHYEGGTGGQFNRDDLSASPASSTGTISDTISEMPKGSRIRLNVYPLAIRQYSVSLGTTRYISPPGDGGGGKTEYRSGSMHLTNGRVRIRVWVDGTNIADRTLTFPDVSESNSGDTKTLTGSQSYTRDDGFSLEYTYPAYRGSSQIQARIDMSSNVSYTGAWYGGTISYTGGGLMVSGDVYRLG